MEWEWDAEGSRLGRGLFRCLFTPQVVPAPPIEIRKNRRSNLRHSLFPLTQTSASGSYTTQAGMPKTAILRVGFTGFGAGKDINSSEADNTDGPMVLITGKKKQDEKNHNAANPRRADFGIGSRSANVGHAQPQRQHQRLLRRGRP